MSGRVVASVGSVGGPSATDTVLIGGPSSVATEALVTRLAQRFDSLSVSAPSNLDVTLEAVGHERIDVAVVDRYGGLVADSDPVQRLCESRAVATAVLVEPDATVDVPAPVTIFEREDEWLSRLESWLQAQLGDGPAMSDTGSAREQYERMLEDQNDRLREFTGVISHELRNPLSVIADRAELARQTGDLDHVDAIAETAANMEAFLDDLLELARQGRVVGDPEPVSLADAAAAAWQETAAPEAALTVEGSRTVVADPARLRELLGNLFANAVDHAGPEVTITVDTLEGGFFVADDGPGIPEGERSAVFDHGYTTSEDGTGFGLSIVEAIVSAHGWEIDIRDDHAGACFAITGVETRPEGQTSDTGANGAAPQHCDPHVAGIDIRGEDRRDRSERE
jgi:signal transduction histidine kinase